MVINFISNSIYLKYPPTSLDYSKHISGKLGDDVNANICRLFLAASEFLHLTTNILPRLLIIFPQLLYNIHISFTFRSELNRMKWRLSRLPLLLVRRASSPKCKSVPEYGSRLRVCNGRISLVKGAVIAVVIT